MKPEQILKTLLSDASVRRSVTRQSHKWFFSVFLSQYMQHELALFQEEMIHLSESNQKLTVVMAFRGSGKSTIMNLSYALWAILGVQQKRFVVIVSKTQSQAKNHLQCIRDELEHNTLLKQDLGPFQSDETSWGASSLVLTKTNARIMAVSREQSIRGLRHGALRPDLIICDDVEDYASSKTRADQIATYQWFMNEILPLGDDRTKIVVLGNLLNEYSLLMQLHSKILSGDMQGLFRAYPFHDDLKQVMWPSKYNSEEKVEALKKSVGDEDLWDREYLLEYQPKHWLIELHKQSEALKRGEDPYANLPVQHLGKYVISSPRIVITVLTKLAKLREHLPPVQSIGGLYS